ncbi:MAG: phage portal protein [Phycisphaerales bacterium]|nr:MAG: phage portal protein [Phycisphaerales bacterium]
MSNQGFQLQAFQGAGVDGPTLARHLDEHASVTLPRLSRLWSYYRNALVPTSRGGALSTTGQGRWYRLAQEVGLPSRIVGRPGSGLSAWSFDQAKKRREVVVENDIAWRVQTMVDFMFGRPVRLVSASKSVAMRDVIERVLDAVWERSGGIALLQDMALLGHVYGHVDLVLRADEAGLRRLAGMIAARTGNPGDAMSFDDDGEAQSVAHDGSAFDEVLHALRHEDLLRIEVIEPRRGVAMLDPSDYRTMRAYVVRQQVAGGMSGSATGGGGIERESARESSFSVRAWLRGEWTPKSWNDGKEPAPASDETVEILSSSHRQVYSGGKLVVDEAWGLTPGVVPVVHIQNIAQPFQYAGQGDVEPLIPLQDELNTRLSDRAYRVTLQSFKMFLAKGIEGAETMFVGPGQIWATDNPQAQVIPFGGDSDSPSEREHIQEIREAMDKASGVPPLASGVVRAKLGNLTSATALRITLMGLLTRTARKRVTYGGGMSRISAMVLQALDAAEVLATRVSDRDVRVQWGGPVPVDVDQAIRAASEKVTLGVPRERVLDELGYGREDEGLT